MIIKTPIDLKLTQESGQTSQPPWMNNNCVYSDVVDNAVFSLKQSGKNIDFTFEGDVTKNHAVERLNYIYDLDFNLDKFYKYLNSHEELKDMSKFCNGLRLFLAKDSFECLISSICSANNSIKRWTKSMNDLKKNWGESTGNYYSFPQKLPSIDDLKSVGVGYRAEYMKKAETLFEPSQIASMNYDEAFESILDIPGVGPKVADCILLYGFGFREAFPTDVWIKRIVSHLYFDGRDIKVEKVREFGMDEFGDYAGYVQLYMFHYARKSGLMDKLKKQK